MRRGGFPGQEEAFRELIGQIRDQRDRASRRAVLGTIVGGVAGIASGSAVMAWLRRVPATGGASATARERSWAVDWSNRPTEWLWNRKGTVLVRLAAVEGDLGAQVWMGVARLIQRAVDGSARDRLELSSLLNGFLARKPPPSHMHPWLEMLRRS